MRHAKDNSSVELDKITLAAGDPYRIYFRRGIGPRDVLERYVIIQDTMAWLPRRAGSMYFLSMYIRLDLNSGGSYSYSTSGYCAIWPFWCLG